MTVRYRHKLFPSNNCITVAGNQIKQNKAETLIAGNKTNVPNELKTSVREMFTNRKGNKRGRRENIRQSFY